ncbi:MAG: hypothetical protein V5A43_10105 [Haloarculaceae archaeon]
MTLDELGDDVSTRYGELGEDYTVSLDRETRNELAMLQVALEPEDIDDLLRRGVHALFQSVVERGNLDFHLRRGYDVTYDEYLMGATMDTYMDTSEFPQADQNDDRRYQF